jgi:hypothetical protein
MCHNFYDIFKNFSKWHPGTWTEVCTDLWTVEGHAVTDVALKYLTRRHFIVVGGPLGLMLTTL